MAARELRYAWFASLMKEEGFDALAIAHNANDNVETLILNLLRGTGIRGLRGMDDGGGVLRPLLGLTRAEIEAYALEHAVPYRTDRTNLENDAQRNKIRNLVFPVFKQINPSFVRTLNRDMEHFRQASDVLDSWFESRKEEVCDTNGDILTEKLMADRNWKYLLFRLLEEYGFNEAAIDDVALALKSEGGTFSGKRFAGKDCELVTAAGRLVVVRDEGALPEYSLQRLDYTPEMKLKCPDGIILLDEEKLPEKWEIRQWREGDWFVPLGMSGRKKLSDFFTDLHLDLGAKRKALVLAPSSGDTSHVLAVLGRRIDDKVKVTPATAHILKIRL